MNNLLVFGLPEDSGETESELTEAVVHKLFGAKLGIKVKSVDRIHRLGKRKPNSSRPVIMNFYDHREKEHVLKNCGKLKGTTISVSNDYAKETVYARKMLWQSCETERAKGAKVKLIHDKLKVNGALYQWDQKRNIRSQCKQQKDKKERNQDSATSAHRSSSVPELTDPSGIKSSGTARS